MRVAGARPPADPSARLDLHPVAPEVRVFRIDNPQTGEHMEFRLTARESHGEVLRMEFVLDPGGLVAGLHTHPHQTDRFEVLEGTLRVRVGGVERELHSGETLTVEAGTPHVPWNSREEPARVLVEFRPALRTQELLETLFAWVSDGKTREGIPVNPLRLAVFALEYRREIRVAPDSTVPFSRLPAPVLDGLVIAVGGLARLLGMRTTPPPSHS
jgi:quercetin dioxygenase-like cupin family protein